MPENKMADSKMPENKIPDSKMPENKIPENKMPENKMPDSKIPESKMPIEKIKERSQELAKEIEYHARKYYTEDDAEISDGQYDALFRELEALEKEYPSLKSPYSPTLRVGGAVLDFLPKAKHSQRMYSLDNAFSAEEWEDFLQRILKILPEYSKKDLHFWLEPKMDGLAIELIYEQGIFSQALTRGDGELGEIVSENLRTVKNVPLCLEGYFPERLEVRGELIIAKKDFEALNEREEKLGRKTFANPRNAAAGSVRQLDSSVAAARPLRFIAYGSGQIDWGGRAAKLIAPHDLWDSQQKIILGLKKLGFTIAPGAELCPDPDKVVPWMEELGRKKPDYEFELDGGVAKINDLDIQEKLGYTANAPRWAIAWKFASLQAETSLEDIIIQVGRTGALTPVGVLKPVSVGGVVISRATLHNEDEIRAKNLLIGDQVLVQRAGDVIPEIVKSLIEKRTGAEREFIFPENCPECGNHVHRQSGEAAWRCINRLCPALIRESIKHFASKAGLDIVGLGARLVEIFIDQGLVKSPADLFKLKKEALLGLERMGEKSAENILKAVEDAKNNASLPRLLAALGIRHVGQQTARSLARHFGSIDALAKADEAELILIDDLGPEIARSIIDFFAEEGNRTLLLELKSLGLWPLMPAFAGAGDAAKNEAGAAALKSVAGAAALKSVAGGISELSLFGDGYLDEPKKQTALILAGKSFVFTGSLSKSRREAEELVLEQGGDVLKSVSKKLDYLVAGDSPGSKLDQARKHGVSILDEKGFLKLIGRDSI